MMKPKVLLIEKQSLFREAIEALLARHGGVELVGAADDGISGIDAARERAPDIVILDTVLPGRNGIDTTRRLLQDLPNVKVIALSSIYEARAVARTLQAGAVAFLSKDECTASDLYAAIEKAQTGEIYLCPKLAGSVVQDYLLNLETTSTPTADSLSPREREVLQLLAEGHSTKAIADVLGISAKTVETHRKRTMDKLGINNVPSLTKFAIKEGLTSL